MYLEIKRDKLILRIMPLWGYPIRDRNVEFAIFLTGIYDFSYDSAHVPGYVYSENHGGIRSFFFLLFEIIMLLLRTGKFPCISLRIVLLKYFLL